MIPQGFPNDRLIEFVQIQNPNLTATMGHIINDVVGLGLPHVEFIFVATAGLNQFHEGFYSEGVVLGGDTKPFFALLGAGVAGIHQVGLV